MPSSQPSISPGSTPRGGENPAVADLRKGDKLTNVILLVAEANFKQTRNNKYFIQMSLRDRTGSVRAVRWDASTALYDSFSPHDFLRLSGRVEEFQQNLQLVVDAMERVPPESVDVEQFLPTADRPPEEMERELLETVAAVQDEDCKALLTRLLDDSETRARLRRCPAGKTIHHAYVGGLLEHILSLIQLARLIGKNYPHLDTDLLIAAAVVHDIGKLWELTYDHAFSYSDQGQLVGHIGLGISLLEKLAQEIPDFPKEKLHHLQHIIASHHGTPEHGALKLPMTAEAIAFHLLDNLDAKLATVAAIGQGINTQENGDSEHGRWSEYYPTLGRRLFFPQE